MQQGSLEIEEVLRRRILRAVEQEEAPSSIELAEEWEAEELVDEALGLAQPRLRVWNWGFRVRRAKAFGSKSTRK
jgi:hypothetical protein